MFLFVVMLHHSGFFSGLPGPPGRDGLKGDKVITEKHLFKPYNAQMRAVTKTVVRRLINAFLRNRIRRYMTELCFLIREEDRGQKG